MLALLDPPTRGEVNGLLAYADDRAGGLMSTRYARVRPEMTADEAVSGLRQQARAQIETIYVAYVLDDQQRLLGVVSFRDLFAAQPHQRVQDVMRTDVVTVSVEEDQEVVGRLFARHDLAAIPVIDEDRRMRGIVTVDDIVDVVDQEATEDIQKFGGVDALRAPYLQLALHRMVTKRAGWLAALFMGEMLTATAMAHFQDEIARAVVLSLFVPLDHQQRRQLWLAGIDPRDPGDDARRGEVARLVAGRSAGTHHGPRAGIDAGDHRLPAHLCLARGQPHLRGALPASGVDRVPQPGGGRPVRYPGRLAAPSRLAEVGP